MSLGLLYKNTAHIFDEVEKETPYLEYPLFQKTGIVTSAFSTRLVEADAYNECACSYSGR